MTTGFYTLKTAFGCLHGIEHGPQCRASIIVKGETFAEVKAAAEKAGWSFEILDGRTSTFCPEHAGGFTSSNQPQHEGGTQCRI